MTDDTPELVAEVRGLRTDVRALLTVVDAEREGRRQSQALAERSRRWLRAAVVLLVVVGSLWIYDLRRDAQLSCSTRTRSRTEIRATVVAIVDEVARYVELAASERATLLDRAEQRAIEELPPPDC